MLALHPSSSQFMELNSAPEITNEHVNKQTRASYRKKTFRRAFSTCLVRFYRLRFLFCVSRRGALISCDAAA